MNSKFKDISKALSSSFGIPITTLNKWASSDNRIAHREIMVHAHNAISVIEDYSELISSRKTLEEIAYSLGFDAPLSMTIEGVSSRTFRSWFENDDKRKQVIGFLIGIHWTLLSEASKKIGTGSTVEILDKLKGQNVMPGEFIRLYKISPDTVINLVLL